MLREKTLIISLNSLFVPIQIAFCFNSIILDNDLSKHKCTEQSEEKKSLVSI